MNFGCMKEGWTVKMWLFNETKSKCYKSLTINTYKREIAKTS